MIPMNQASAIKYSIEIAKIMCEREGNGLSVNRGSAEELADFIEILQNRFTGKRSETE
mgnify:CR=1 FL=1